MVVTMKKEYQPAYLSLCEDVVMM